MARRKVVLTQPQRMKYAESAVYLSDTINSLTQQLINGTRTTEDSIRVWEAACAHAWAATSQTGIPGETR